MKHCALLSLVGMSSAFTPSPALIGLRSSMAALQMSGEGDPIVSPFDDSRSSGEATTATYTPSEATELEGEFLDLTYDNVELVLDEMRPYLIQDGGNVAIAEIDGPVVRLELQVRSSYTNPGQHDHNQLT